MIAFEAAMKNLNTVLAWQPIEAPIASQEEAPIAAAPDGSLISADVEEEEETVGEGMDALLGQLTRLAWETNEQPRERRRPVMQRGSVREQAWQVAQDIINDRVSPEAFETLDSLTSQDAEGVADALESIVSDTDGPEQMMALLQRGTRSTVATRGCSGMLAGLAGGSAERTVGILLLTTDHEGGADSVAAVFGAAASDSDSASNMIAMLANGVATPLSAGGIVELLDALTAPGQDGGREGCTAVATCLGQAVRWFGGSSRVSQALRPLLDVDGGTRCIVSLIQRSSMSRDGRAAMLRVLLALARHDGEGTTRLLTRASASRDGARLIMEALHRMADAPKTQRLVDLMLTRVGWHRSESALWANLRANAASTLQTLLERIYGPQEQIAA